MPRFEARTRRGDGGPLFLRLIIAGEVVVVGFGVLQARERAVGTKAREELNTCS